MESRLFLSRLIWLFVNVRSDLNADNSVWIGDHAVSASTFFDFVYELHAGNNFAPDGVFAIKAGNTVEADEELAVTAIGIIGASHGDCASNKLLLGELSWQIFAGATHAGTGRIAALSHEAIDDAVEDNAIIKLHADKFFDAFNMLRSKFRIHFNDHSSSGEVEQQGVFFVHSVSGNCEEQGKQGRNQQILECLHFFLWG